MKADEFIKHVKEAAGLESREEALQATHATLTVLGERLFGGEREHLAAQLPPELQTYLLEADRSEKFNLDEFFERISEEEGIDVDEAAEHARAVISVLCESVTPGEINDLKSQLPKDFAAFFDEVIH